MECLLIIHFRTSLRQVQDSTSLSFAVVIRLSKAESFVKVSDSVRPASMAEG